MLDMTLDYGPLALTDITDINGKPAQIDGGVQFKLEQDDGTPITDAGAIVVTSGDPRFPDGSVIYSPDPAKGAVEGATFRIAAHCDPNLNPDVTDDAVLATVSDVLTTPTGPAAVARLNLGAGVARP